MNYISTGDMAQAYQMRRHNVQLKEHVNRLTEEMTTGVKADLAKAVSGDFMALAGIDRSLRTLDAYQIATLEAGQHTGVMQEVLGAMQNMSSQIGPTLLTAATTTNGAQIGVAAMDARQKFLGAVGTLNAEVGGRYVFSGMTSDVRPFANGEAMLASMMTAISAETSAGGIATAVNAWFSAPPGGGGYRDVGYLGSNTGLAPFRIGPDEAASIPVTGNDQAIRDVLEGLALSALIAEGALSGDTIERSRLARLSGEKILGSDGSMVALRAQVGTAEGYIEEVGQRNSSEQTALGIARSKIVAADPYDTASALEAVTAQMEALYTLTARLSRLKFTDYI